MKHFYYLQYAIHTYPTFVQCVHHFKLLHDFVELATKLTLQREIHAYNKFSRVDNSSFTALGGSPSPGWAIPTYSWNTYLVPNTLDGAWHIFRKYSAELPNLGGKQLMLSRNPTLMLELILPSACWKEHTDDNLSTIQAISMSAVVGFLSCVQKYWKP